MFLTMVQTFWIITLLLGFYNCYEVRLSKISTIFLPYAYQPNDRGMYGLPHNAAEQFAYDHVEKIIYTVGDTVLHAIDVSNPDNMTVLSHVEYPGVEFTDIEFCGGHIFTALDNKTDKANGQVIIFSQHNTTTSSMTELMRIHVGAVPDMVKPTSDCSKLVVAVEGEAYESPPSQITDPPGLVVIITFPNGVNADYNKVSLNFTYYDDKVDELSESGVRHVYQENNNPFSNDVEPEYIAINHDDTIAYVGLQENNAVATVDLLSQTITGIHGLGFKNWSQLTLDPSDKDRGGMMFPYSVMGMYQPDAIKYFTFKGVNYLVMANEGDSKDYNYASWSEESRGSNLNSTLLSNLDDTTRDQLARESQLGRLKVSVSPAGVDTSGRLKALYTFGGRSFSIRRADDMSLVYDSGNDISTKIFEHRHILFNGHMGPTNERPYEQFDVRSDDKGAETESVTVGEVDGVTLLFVANERPGTIFVYSLHSDISSPMYHDIYDGIPDTRSKTWQQLYDERVLSDIDPEDIHFIPASKSPTGKPVLFVTGSVTGTLTIIDINITPSQQDLVTTPKPCVSSVMRTRPDYFFVSLFIAVTSLQGSVRH